MMRVSAITGSCILAWIIGAGLTLALPQDAYGQARAYRTGIKVECAGGNEQKSAELTLAALSSKIAAQTAESLCLILKPAVGTSARLFCAYKVGGVVERDDDTGAPGLFHVNDTIKEHLRTFVSSSRCTSGDASDRLIGAIGALLAQGTISPDGLIARVGPTATPIDTEHLGTFRPVSTKLAFPAAVHDYLGGLNPLDTSGAAAQAGKVSGSNQSQQETVRKLEEEKTALTSELRKKQVEIDTLKKYLASDLWLLGLGGIVVGLIVLGVYSHMTYAAAKRQLALQRADASKQRRAWSDADLIRRQAYASLMDLMRIKDEGSSAMDNLRQIVSGISKDLAQFDREVTISDEKEIQSQFVKDLEDAGALQPTPQEGEAESAWWQVTRRRKEKREKRLRNTIAEHFGGYLRQSTSLIGQYQKLCNRIHEELSQPWFKNVTDGSISQSETGAQGKSGRSASQEAPSRSPEAPSSAIASSLKDIQSSFTTLSQEVRKVVTSQQDHISDQKKETEWISRLEESLRTKKWLLPGERPEEGVTRLIYEQQESLKLLPEYQSSNPGSVLDRVKEVERRLSVASKTIGRAAPGATGLIDQLVTHMMFELSRAKVRATQADTLERARDECKAQIATLEPEAAAGRELSEECVQYLGLNRERIVAAAAPAQMLLRTIKSEPREYRELRYRLLAVQMAFDRAKEETESNRLFQPLHLDEWLPNLRQLLVEMQDWKQEELVDRGLLRGFSEGWLHRLLRADLLMNAYFAEDDRDFFLRDAVAQASAAIRVVLFKYQARIGVLKLLEPAPEGMKIDRDADPLLRELPEVETKVVRKYQESGQPTTFVVDVRTFPLSIGGRRYAEGRVVIMNPSNWLQK